MTARVPHDSALPAKSIAVESKQDRYAQPSKDETFPHSLIALFTIRLNGDSRSARRLARAVVFYEDIGRRLKVEFRSSW
jgi:hypothetical protein